LIDEATAAIDQKCEEALVSILSSIIISNSSVTGTTGTKVVEYQQQSSAVTVLMICHKQDGLKRLCDKELVMSHGSVESFRDL
jgi:ABC-type methionine transport system ATPase subunit